MTQIVKSIYPFQIIPYQYDIKMITVLLSFKPLQLSLVYNFTNLTMALLK